MGGSALFVWLIFGGIILSLYVLCYMLVLYYVDPQLRHPISTFVTIASLLCALLCVMIVPLDVLFTVDAGELAIAANIADVDIDMSVGVATLSSMLVKTAYVVLFSALAALAFLVTPFAYFFVEDYSVDEDYLNDTAKSSLGAGRRTCAEKTCSSLKSTSVFILVVLILTLVGLFFEPGEHDAYSVLSGVDNTRVSVTVSAFVNTLTDFKSGGGGERALLLVIACLCVFGLFNSVLYTGYGLAALPVNLFRGFRKLEDEQLMIEYDRLKLRQNRTALQNKYETSNKHSQLKILRQLKKLEHKELIMVRHLNALEEKNNECSYRFYRLLYPFRASVGGCMFALTLLLLLSMFVNCVDRLMHSPCGFSCGYLLNSSQWFNPFDVLLVRSSSYFPIDYLALAAVGMYWFMATMYGVLRLGIRVFGCFQIFKIRHRRTSPQAMLLCALITSVAVLALTTQLGALAPQYTSFGPQRYAPSPADLADSIKHTTHAHPNSGFSISSGASAAGAVGGDNTLPCALTASRGNGRCAMTQISIFLHRITISLPVFSIAFYLLNWLFIAFTSLCIIQQVYREADTRFASVIDEDCSEDELERELMHLKENYAARSTRSNSIRASSSNHGSDTSNMYNRSTKQGQSCVPDDLRRKYITTRGNDNSNSNDSGGSSSESDGNSTSNSLTARGNQRFAKYKDELETIDEFDSANIEVDRDNGLYNDGLDGDVDGLYDDDDMGLANAGGMSRSDMDAIWAKYGRFRNTSADGEQNV